MPDSLSDLLARVEEAEGPDRELDKDILCALLTPMGAMEFACSGPLNHKPTASLDAALALVERALPGWDWAVFRRCAPGFGDELASARVWPHREMSKGSGDCRAKTPALALLAALLRARME